MEIFCASAKVDGTKISLREFALMLEALGMESDPDKFDREFDAIDVDGDGRFELNEFIDWWVMDWRGISLADMKRSFDEFDVQHTGSISTAEFLRIAKQNGQMFSNMSDFSSAWQEIDLDHDGMVTW